jgi:hypothetical protein
VSSVIVTFSAVGHLVSFAEIPMPGLHELLMMLLDDSQVLTDFRPAESATVL